MSKTKQKSKRKGSLKNIKKFKKNGPSEPSELRERSGIDVLKAQDEEDFYPELVIPSCTHGKCLLFSQQDSTNPSKQSRWFGCAFSRSHNHCSFQCKWPKNSHIQSVKATPTVENLPRPFLPDKVAKLLSGATKHFYFCKKCVDVFPSESHFHALQGPFTDSTELFNLTPALQNDSTQAQYWFSPEALQVLLESAERSEIKEFICVGTPKFFKFVKDQGKKAFLLDIDDRFQAFFRKNECARYNMINNEFLDESKQFEKFLKTCKAPLIVCDPPFGALIKPLIWSLRHIASMSPASMEYVIAFPYFFDKHFNRSMPELKMVDYMVPYQNHPTFKVAKKSPVRFFTTLDRKSFILPQPLYKHCKLCDRYVTAINNHCSTCGQCPSRDGLAVKHCNICDRCVPEKYKHCKKCNRCSLNGRCHAKDNKVEN